MSRAAFIAAIAIPTMLLAGLGWALWTLQIAPSQVLSELGAERVPALLEALEALGPQSAWAYTGLVALSVVISPIPCALIVPAAGALWDPVWAGSLSVAGAFVGSLIAYALGRLWGRPLLRAIAGKTVTAAPQGDRPLGGLVLALRLLPMVAFGSVSYASGLAGLALPTYATATLLGSIPSTLSLSYAGASIASGQPLGVALAIASLTVLVGVATYTRRKLGIRQLVRLD